MRNRRIGQITRSATGLETLEWQANPSGYSEDCHIQVTQDKDATFTSQVSGSMDAIRLSPADLTAVESGDHLHKDVPICPYMTVTINTTVAPTTWPVVYDVWVVE